MCRTPRVSCALTTRYQYLKHGQAFAFRNYVDELQPQVVLPLKYLHELKNAPESKLSLKRFSELVSHACHLQLGHI